MRTGSSKPCLSEDEVLFLSDFPPLPSATFYARGKLSQESKLSSSFSNGHRVWCYFNLSRYALGGESRQILAATLAGPAEPGSHLAQQPHCPREQRPPCLWLMASMAWHSSPHEHLGYTVASVLRRMPEEAMEWVVNHILSCCLLLMPVSVRTQP